MLGVPRLDDDAQRVRDLLGATHRFAQRARHDERDGGLRVRMPRLQEMGAVTDLSNSRHLYRTPRFITRSTLWSRLMYRNTSPLTAVMSGGVPSLIVPTSRSTFMATAGQ